MLMGCQQAEPQEESAQLDLATLSSGVYRAYPTPSSADTLPSPPFEGGGGGGSAFYISSYNRHGSRFQPNDKRYSNTLRRLQEAHERGALTSYGESLLPQIQTLCDSCLGHGGLLTRVGEKQLAGIGARMAQHYPEVFESGRFISARASVVPRCGASMRSFFKGLHETLGKPTNSLLEVDSAYMSYIAYDSPQMRQLSAKDAFWYADFDRYYRQHTLQESVVKRLFTDATGLDSLQCVDDLYWLCIGMQNVDVPGCDLSGAMTPEELFECYRCVNYRMYICNANAPMSRHIPAESASTLLQNIVESADRAIATDTVAADLRFGHDSNLLRLMALMRIKGCTAEVEDPAEAYHQWKEAEICPMGANLQLVYTKRPSGPTPDPSRSASLGRGEDTNANEVLVMFLHNEKPTSLDVEGFFPVCDHYYRWNEVREFFLTQIKTDNSYTEFIEPVQ